MCAPSVSVEGGECLPCPRRCSVTVPSVVAPSVNVTAPVGATEPTADVTVAVSVTAWPTTDGFAVDAIAVELGSMTPLPVLVNGIGMHWPPATGHSKTFGCRVEGGDAGRLEALRDGAGAGAGE